MLAREFRLTRRAVPIVLKRGSRLHTSLFSVIVQPCYLSKPRFTVVVSNKQINHAPRRARVKRRLRAMIQLVFFQSTLLSKYDCIFLAKPAVETTGWQELVATGNEIFTRLHHLGTKTTD